MSEGIVYGKEKVAAETENDDAEENCAAAIKDEDTIATTAVEETNIATGKENDPTTIKEDITAIKDAIEEIASIVKKNDTEIVKKVDSATVEECNNTAAVKENDAVEIENDGNDMSTENENNSTEKENYTPNVNDSDDNVTVKENNITYVKQNENENGNATESEMYIAIENGNDIQIENGNDMAIENENNTSTEKENNVPGVKDSDDTATVKGNNIVTQNESGNATENEKCTAVENGNDMEIENENDLATEKENNTSAKTENNTPDVKDGDNAIVKENNITLENENGNATENENDMTTENENNTSTKKENNTPNVKDMDIATVKENNFTFVKEKDNDMDIENENDLTENENNTSTKKENNTPNVKEGDITAVKENNTTFVKENENDVIAEHGNDTAAVKDVTAVEKENNTTAVADNDEKAEFDLPEKILLKYTADQQVQLVKAYRILQVLMYHSKNSNCGSAFFEKPRNDEYRLTRYYDIISNPMWFNEIKRKFFSAEYTSLVEVIKDMRLIFENCYFFWGPKTELSDHCLKIERLLERQIWLLPRELKALCSLDITHGMDDSMVIKVWGSVKNKGKGSVNLMLRAWARRRIIEMERFKTESTLTGDLAKKVTRWENIFCNSMEIRKSIQTMFELVQIGQFVRIMEKFWDLKAISQTEIEKMFIFSQYSSAFLDLLKNIIKMEKRDRDEEDGKINNKFETYDDVMMELKEIVSKWYDIYNDETLEVCDEINVKPSFFDLMGEENPLLTERYEDLPYPKKVLLIKYLCCYMMHTQTAKTVDNIEKEAELHFPQILGTDKQNYSYLHYPTFSSFRLYRQKLKVTGHDALVFGSFSGLDYERLSVNSSSEEFKMVADSLEGVRFLIDELTFSDLEFCKKDGKSKNHNLITALRKLEVETLENEKHLIAQTNEIRVAMYTEWKNKQEGYESLDEDFEHTEELKLEIDDSMYDNEADEYMEKESNCSTNEKAGTSAPVNTNDNVKRGSGSSAKTAGEETTNVKSPIIDIKSESLSAVYIKSEATDEFQPEADNDSDRSSYRARKRTSTSYRDSYEDDSDSESEETQSDEEWTIPPRTKRKPIRVRLRRVPSSSSDCFTCIPEEPSGLKLVDVETLRRPSKPTCVVQPSTKVETVPVAIKPIESKDMMQQTTLTYVEAPKPTNTLNSTYILTSDLRPLNNTFYAVAPASQQILVLRPTTLQPPAPHPVIVSTETIRPPVARTFTTTPIIVRTETIRPAAMNRCVAPRPVSSITRNAVREVLATRRFIRPATSFAPRVMRSTQYDSRVTQLKTSSPVLMNMNRQTPPRAPVKRPAAPAIQRVLSTPRKIAPRSQLRSAGSLSSSLAPTRPALHEIEGTIGMRLREGALQYVVNLPNGTHVPLSAAQVQQLRAANNGALPPRLKIPVPADVAEKVQPCVVIDD